MVEIGGSRSTGGGEYVASADGLEAGRVRAGVQKTVAATRTAVRELVGNEVISRGQRNGDGRDIREGMTEGRITQHAGSADEQGSAIVRAGSEHIVSGRRDLQQPGVGRHGVGARAGHHDGAGTESAVSQARRQDVRRGIAEAGDRGGDDGRRSGGQHRQISRESAGSMAEGGDIRRKRDDGVLHAHRIRAAQHNRISDQGGTGGGIDQVREDEGATADVHGLVAGEAEHDRGGAGGDVQPRRGTVGGIAGQVQDAQDVPIGGADVERLSAVQQQFVDLNGITCVGAVIADADVGEAQGAADSDLACVGNDAVAAGAAVEQRQHAVVGDRGGSADIDRSRRASVDARQGQGAGVDRHAAGEGVVAAQEQRTETLLREGEALGGFADRAVQGQDGQRLLDVHGEVAGQGRRAVQRQRLDAGVGQGSPKRVRIVDRVGAGREQPRAGSHRERAHADRSRREGRRFSRHGVTGGDVGASSDDEAAGADADTTGESALRTQLEQAVARLGDSFGTGADDRCGDVELGQVGMEHPVAEFDVIDREVASDTAEAHRAERAERNHRVRRGTAVVSAQD